MADSEPLLVRAGLRYFRAWHEGAPRVADVDGIHFLNPDERAALRRVTRGAIVRAAVAGAISAIISAVTEVLAHPILGAEPDHATLEQHLRFYAIVGGATVLASIIEILYLYWDGLRAVHALAREAGLDLFPAAEDDKALAGAMARAALELPNSSAKIFGVDPFREASRLRIFVASIVYKLKVSVTNFATKMLIRRMLGRAFVRAWLPFVAVPITAAWNAWICFLIMREARIRAMGPSASMEMMKIVLADGTALSDAGRETALRAVASSIVRTEDLHPNLVALLREVGRRVGLDPNEAADLDDSSLFLKKLSGLPESERTIVLRILAVASILDGRLTRAEKRLLREARAISGRDDDLGPVERLRRAFLDGDILTRERIETL
jgi:hypothetical protein